MVCRRWTRTAGPVPMSAFISSPVFRAQRKIGKRPLHEPSGIETLRHLSQTGMFDVCRTISIVEWIASE